MKAHLLCMLLAAGPLTTSSLPSSLRLEDDMHADKISASLEQLESEPVLSGTDTLQGDGWVGVRNGRLWCTVNGDTVQAHAPGFLHHGGRWWMVGEDRSHPWTPDVNLYSSPDLTHWQFESKIIANGITDPRLGRSRMIERAKLMRNTRTGQFVVWCHWEARNYGASEAACFVSDSVRGPYRMAWSGRPLGIKSRDCNIFVDAGGEAYFISTTEENQHLGLFRLADDYLSVTSHQQLFPHQQREAPVIVRVPASDSPTGCRYFMLSSACSGWAPNQCKYAYTDDLAHPWSELHDVGDATAYRTQAAAVLTIEGTRQTTYLYVGDRWMDPTLPESKTIIFPITFSGTECQFHYMDSFRLNLQTGEWCPE